MVYDHLDLRLVAGRIPVCRQLDDAAVLLWEALDDPDPEASPDDGLLPRSQPTAKVFLYMMRWSGSPFDSLVVVVVLTLTRIIKSVRGHRTGSRHFGVEARENKPIVVHVHQPKTKNKSVFGSQHAYVSGP